MKTITSSIRQLKATLPENVTLVAVSKLHPAGAIEEAYAAGQRVFGESKAQELTAKYEQLPKDIEWHFIGHLQTNKVKYIAPFIHTIQTIDSLKLLQKVDEQAALCGRNIRVLLQIHIALETEKFGFSPDECRELLRSGALSSCQHITICGLMGMATFTDDKAQVLKEFDGLRTLFDAFKRDFFTGNASFSELSMGMSQDYSLAVSAGSTMVRIGGLIFGERY